MRMRLILTASSAAFVCGILLWEHTHGGVVTHTVMARDDMPGLSNWWGGLLLPALAWFLLGRIQQRGFREKQGRAPLQPGTVLAGFAGAAAFGGVLSVFFVAGREDLTSGMAMALVPLALLFPIYRAEYVLGFVMAMTVTFGAILPTVFAGLVALMALPMHRIPRALVVAIAGWIKPPRALPARDDH